MIRKIGIIGLCVIAIVLVNQLHFFGHGGAGIFLDLLLTFLIGKKGYKLLRTTNPVRPLIKETTGKWTNPSFAAKGASLKNRPDLTAGTGAAHASPIRTVLLIFIIVFIIGAYKLVSAASLNFFTWGDHILSQSQIDHPVLIWALVGMLFGAGIGSLVAWQKYHLSFRWCLAAATPALLCIWVLQAISDPLSSIQPNGFTLTDKTDTSSQVESVQVLSQRRKRVDVRAAVKIASVPKETVKQAASCETLQDNIIIHARNDSVNVYYRTSSHHNGPWSDWKLKFVPQQGQFSLTEDGPVTANSIQYYYEINAVLTRSAQNPYTRLLCDGPLVIDTF